MSEKRRIDTIKLFANFLITGFFLSLYLKLVLNLDLPSGFVKLAHEGIFPVSVAIIGVVGFLSYKLFDWREDLKGIKSAAGAMIIWFLILLILKFLA